MSTFDLYAAYYDLLYEDKDYQAESAFVSDLIAAAQPDARSIAEFGCGTGRHALALADLGYSIAGIDMSQGMVAQANERLSKSRLPPGVMVDFRVADVRSVDLDRTFDCAISLFHVVSYQNSDADLAKMMRTVAEHLDRGGVFVFDCWYGPAVLTNSPEVRVKRKENAQIKVVRIAEPGMRFNQNIVDVNYTIFIEDKSSGAIHCAKELHSMRYLFLPEIRALLTNHGFAIQRECEWVSGKDLDASTWSAAFVAVKL